MTMTTASAQETVTRPVGSGFALLPRVNLLPPEIAERRKVRQIQGLLGASLVAVVALIGLAFVAASHSVSAAQENLTTAQAENTQLQNQVKQYANVNAIYAAADAAQAQLVTAMGDEVRFSQLLTSLSLSTPSTVWITNMTLSTAALTPSTTGIPTIGTFTVTGMGFGNNDVALWLESVAGVKTYSDPYFSTSTESLIGTRKVVTFTSTANLTTSAFSNRYTATPKAGG
jgi:Tfp pilus assembly protein PilN